MITITDILVVSLFLTAVAMWWQGQGVKVFALSQVKKRCDHEGVQLLDESLVLNRLGVARNNRGGLQLKRRFAFEFSVTGAARYQGNITLLGYAVLSIELAAFPIQ